LHGAWRSESALKPRHAATTDDEREKPMSVVKVIEVLSQSDKSWEDAAQIAVKTAAKTVKDIRSIWISNFEAQVENGKIVKYRVNAKLSFAIKGTEKL
jgi:hypothetical protein